VTPTIGQALRATREAAGVTIAQLARQAAFSESHLRSIENGNRTVTRDVAAAYDRALSTGGIVVDLYYAAQAGDDVRRRQALALLGTVSALGVSAPQLIAESLRESLLSACDTGDWPEIVAEDGQRFMIDSPTSFRTHLTGDLLVLRQSLSQTDALPTRLAAPRLMMLHGMVTANLGDAAKAARWYRAARLAADRARDDELRQWVRGRAAFRIGYEGAPPQEVLVLASDVHDVEAKLAVAQAFARLGAKAKALASLNEARRIHESVDQSETTIYAMPPWRMALSAAYVYALIGDVQRCDAELVEVSPPPFVQRWESQLKIQRAVACARSGDIVSGSQLAESVLRDTPKEERSIVLMEMYRLIKNCAARS
jgi:transcriptional regulator with XRE-family HTH domain